MLTRDELDRMLQHESPAMVDAAASLVMEFLAHSHKAVMAPVSPAVMQELRALLGEIMEFAVMMTSPVGLADVRAAAGAVMRARAHALEEAADAEYLAVVAALNAFPADEEACESDDQEAYAAATELGAPRMSAADARRLLLAD